ALTGCRREFGRCPCRFGHQQSLQRCRVGKRGGAATFFYVIPCLAERAARGAKPAPLLPRSASAGLASGQVRSDWVYVKMMQNLSKQIVWLLSNQFPKDPTCGVQLPMGGRFCPLKRPGVAAAARAGRTTPPARRPAAATPPPPPHTSSCA